jgi:hypothetical protein
LQYFVRTIDARKESRQRSVPIVKLLYPELACSTLSQAIDQAKRSVLESDKTIMLQADACFRNLNQVRTKYRCWIDERGTFNELALA